MATAGGAAFTTAVRMVDRVHDDTAVMRTLAAPNGTTGLAVVDVGVVRVGDGADRSKAGAMNETLFTGVQAKDRHALVAADELCVATGGASDLTTLARLHFHIVDDGATGMNCSGMVLPGLTSTAFSEAMTLSPAARR